MRKFVFGLVAVLSLFIGCSFAQQNLPDSAQIVVKDPLIQGEAANLTITMMKNGSTMSSYNGAIFMIITDENGIPLKDTEYILPNQGIYQFSSSDLGSVTFQRGLEIKSSGKFYLEISDYDDNIFGQQLINVQKKTVNSHMDDIIIYSPSADVPLVSDRVDVLAMVPGLPNSLVLVYLDGATVNSSPVSTDSAGQFNYTIPNVSEGEHTLMLEILDIEGNSLGTSDSVKFSYRMADGDLFKSLTISPSLGIRLDEIVEFVVNTDESVETVKMTLSYGVKDEEILLEKKGNGVFGQNVFVMYTGNVNVSLELAANNNSLIKKYDNIQSFEVLDMPIISNVQVITNTEEQKADVSWLVSGDIEYYLINYGYDSSTITGEIKINENKFSFTNVPYDQDVFLKITPYWNEGGNHGAASEVIKFVISKPTVVDNSGTAQSIGLSEPVSSCVVQAISTRTKKIGDKYYLLRDKVPNVSKYIVYSSVTPSIEDRIKIYETTDTSYEYPFDHTSEEDKFMYFWIDGVCDNGEELQLSGATKVQVGPAEHFMLLVLMTLLIYFCIKMFRQTEE